MSLSMNHIVAELTEEWKETRNDANRIPSVGLAVRLLRRLGLLNSEQEELWLRRIQTCPGHDDEGGRDWCAYCGNMPPVALARDAGRGEGGR